jgi:glycerophosphoryl diester phosphodiesterase
MLRYSYLLFFVVLFFNQSNAQSVSTPESIKAKYPIKVIAHRGASGYAPENTLASVKKAIELGANYVEIDVHFSKDKEVVVIHDATLERTTNHIGQVQFYRLEEIKKFDAGGRFSEQYKGEKIPTLDEVIKATKGKAILLIEIKKGTTYYNGIEKKILEIIEQHQAKEWVEVQTFYDPVLKNWLKLNSHIAAHKLMVGNVFPFYVDDMLNGGNIFKKTYGTQGINPNLKWMGNKLFQKIKQNGRTCYVWTVNDEKDIKKAIELKVDGIIGNYPDRVIKLLKK